MADFFKQLVSRQRPNGESLLLLPLEQSRYPRQENGFRGEAPPQAAQPFLSVERPPWDQEGQESGSSDPVHDSGPDRPVSERKTAQFQEQATAGTPLDPLPRKKQKGRQAAPPAAFDQSPPSPLSPSNHHAQDFKPVPEQQDLMGKALAAVEQWLVPPGKQQRSAPRSAAQLPPRELSPPRSIVSKQQDLPGDQQDESSRGNKTPGRDPRKKEKRQPSGAEAAELFSFHRIPQARQPLAGKQGLKLPGTPLSPKQPPRPMPKDIDAGLKAKQRLEPLLSPSVGAMQRPASMRPGRGASKASPLVIHNLTVEIRKTAKPPGPASPQVQPTPAPASAGIDFPFKLGFGLEQI